jgi:hypothetical protein
MAVAFMGVLSVSGGSPDSGLIKAIGLMLMELSILVAVAILFSTFTTSTLSATFTIAIYVIGHLADDIKALAEKLHDGIAPIVLQSLYYVLPNLAFFNLKGDAAYGVPILFGYLVTAIGYGVCYTTIVLAVACTIFEWRDF